MYALFVELAARPEAAPELEELLGQLTRAGAREPGTLAYAVSRQRERPHGFVLFELYRDEAAYHAHMAAANVRAALARFGALLAEPPRLVHGDPLFLHGLPREEKAG